MMAFADLEAARAGDEAYKALADDGVVSTLEAAEATMEAAIDDPQVEAALEVAEDAIEKLQVTVAKKHKRKLL